MHVFFRRANDKLATYHRSLLSLLPLGLLPTSSAESASVAPPSSSTTALGTVPGDVSRLAAAEAAVASSAAASSAASAASAAGGAVARDVALTMS